MKRDKPGTPRVVQITHSHAIAGRSGRRHSYRYDTYFHVEWRNKERERKGKG